jgi:Transposase
MMTRLPPQEFVAFVGIDWADTSPAVCLQVAGSETREFSVLAHTPEAIGAWACLLRQRFGGRPIAVCLELAKGPLVSALSTHDFLGLFPVNAHTVATYRHAFTPSRAKEDPSDAELQLERLLQHRDNLQVLTPQSVTTRALEQLVADRRRLVGDQVRLTNRLTSALKHHCPQVLSWFSDKDTTILGSQEQSPENLRQARSACELKD